MAGRREGLLAAALLAVSYHHVWFSQNARGYTAVAFLAIVATWCLLRGLRTGRGVYGMGYAVAAGLGAYTHLTMVLLAVAQSVVAVGTVLRPPRGWRPSWSVVFTAFLGGAAATLALYAPVLPQVVDYFVDSPSRFVGVSTRSWALLETLRQLQVGFGATAGAAVALTCFVGGAWRFFRRSPVAFGLFASPAVAVILGAALARGTMYPRFFFFMAGFAVLFLIEGAFWTAAVVARLVGPLRGREAALGTAFVAVLIVGSVASLPFNYRLPKQDFEGARTFVLDARSPDEPVFVLGAAIRPMREVAGMPWEGVQTAARLAEVTGAGPVWLVYAMPRLTAETLPDVWSILQRACPEPTVFPGTVGDGEVLVCRTADGVP